MRDPAEVPSPCINLCAIDDATGLCVGCGRTMKEIVTWPMLTPPAKRAVLERIAQRRAAPGDGGGPARPDC